MKASNGRDSTHSEYLEHLRRTGGLAHARRMRDELGWRWEPAVVVWTLRHSAVAWVATACAGVLTIVGLLANLKALLG